MNALSHKTMAEHCGMEVVEITPNSLTMKMPVDHRTIQPMGLLNGGASLALAEWVGSLAGNLVCDKNSYCVGLEINGNHLHPAKSGFVYATAKPFHIGKKTQVWEIDIKNDQGKRICISRLTLAVIQKKING